MKNFFPLLVEPKVKIENFFSEEFPGTESVFKERRRRYFSPPANWLPLRGSYFFNAGGVVRSGCPFRDA